MANSEVKIGKKVQFNWDGEKLTGVVNSIIDDKYVIKIGYNVYRVPKSKLL